MTITVELPDSVGGVLFAHGQEPERAVLEALALEGYRTERLGEADIRRLLAFETRMDVHQFLKQHGVFMHYTPEDLDHDSGVAIDVARRVQADRVTAGRRPDA
jgi:hypothetical protein